MTNRGEAGDVLSEWRTKILNGFLAFAVAACAPVVGMTFVAATKKPGQWPAVALFALLLALLAALAFWRSLSFRVRAAGLLLLGYISAIVSLARGGLPGSGREYLVVLPIVALILVGVRAGLLLSAFSALLLAVFAILADRGFLSPWLLYTQNPLRLADWAIEGGTTLVLLAIAMALLALFHRFQVQLIDDERHARAQLDLAHALLEEQNVILEQTIQQRTLELVQSNQIQTALYKIAEAASTSRSMQDFYAHVHGIVGELMVAGNMFIALYDESTGLLSFPYFVDERLQPFPPQPLADFRGPPGYVIRTGESIKHGWNQPWASAAGLGMDLEGTPYEDAIGAPLRAEGRTLGAIFVQNYRGINYTDKDDQVLAFVAQHIATALTRMRALEETRKRDSELQVINRVQQGLAYRLGLQGIIDLIGDKVAEVFAADTTSVAMYDAERDWISNVYFVDRGKRIPWPDQLASRPSLGVVVIDSREPLLSGSAEESARLGGLFVPPPGEELDRNESYLGVPILAEDRVIGLITVQSYQKNAYKLEDIHLLQTLANSMSIALENARLFDQTQRLLQEAEQRSNELAILNSVSEAMSRTLDLEAVTRVVGDKLREIFQAESVIIMLLDQLTNLIHVPYEFDAEEGGYIDFVEPFPLGIGLASKVILSGEPLMLGTLEEEVAHGAYFPPELLEQSAGVLSQSWLGVPIMVHDHVMGVVVLSDKEPGAFNEAHLHLLQTLSSSMGVAIANARLFQAEQQRVAELATVNTVSRELASELGVGSLIRLVGEQIRTVFRADIAYVALLDESGTTVQFPYTFGEEQAPMRYGEGLASKIIETGESLLINQELDRETHDLGATMIGRRALSYLGVPIFVSGKAVGVISVQSTQREGAFQLNHKHLLTTLAANVSAALHSARLFDEAQEARAAAEQANAEIKQAQDALQESHRRLASIVDLMPDAVLVIDQEGKVITWNRAMEEMTGVRAEEMLGRGNHEYALPFYGERRPILIDLVTVPQREMEEKYTHIRMEGPVLVGETYVPQLREGGHYLLGTASALHDSRGHVVGAIEVIRDFTERKHMEEALRRAKEAAEAATQTKSAFLATMSHEIRTPMNAVIGMAGLLLDTPLTPEQHEFAETIRTSGDALLTIINDILDFSKIEARRMELENQPFDLRECVESALDLLAPSAAEKNLNLGVVVEGDVPAAIVGDVTRLRQVLVNLLSNAVKFTEAGEVVVTVERRGGVSSSRQELHFAVRDTGIGVPPELMGRLFQSFSQVDASTTRRFGGTGLGLAISRHLVELMGGTMWAESPAASPFPLGGPGSAFHFTIQAEVAAVVTARECPQDIQPGLEGKRVLIVDDNPTNRRILSLQTQRWGMEPVQTGSPAEALEWLRRGEPFDVAFVDWQMPDMNGVALVAEIRQLREATALPVVIVSSLGKREAQRDEGDWEAFLLKPIKASQLYNVLVGLFAPAAVGAPVSQAAGRTLFDGEMGRRHPLRILVAEDNLVNQKLALHLLERMGYRADVVANGLEVLQSLRRQPYDVILMDVQMPEMDGLEASRAISHEWSLETRPRIIAMTANVLAEDRQECLAAGMADFVAKPVRVEELVAALGRSSPLAERGGSVPIPLEGETGALLAPGPASLDPAALERLQEMAAGDSGFLVEMIETILADAPGMLAEMHQALEGGDAAMLRRAAHSLKSNLADFGASTLSEQCRVLEMIAKSGALEGAAEELALVESGWAQVRVALKSLRDEIEEGC